MRLRIITNYPEAVLKILVAEELIDLAHFVDSGKSFLLLAYPDESLSQACSYWLAMAQGCTLITSYEEVTQ